MAKIALCVLVDRELLDEMNKLRDTELTDAKGRILYKLHDGNFQEWYRKLLRAGLRYYLNDLERVREKFEAEDG